MVKAVLFDIGGVVIVPRYNRFYRYLFVGLEILLNPFLDSESRIRKCVRMYIETSRLDGDVVRIIKKLRATGYRIGVISNTSPERARANDLMDGYRGFDTVILSHEVGIRKPDERIFKIALERIGLEAGGCVFIDDHTQNVRAAERIGIKGILYKNPRQLERDLAALGVRTGE